MANFKNVQTVTNLSKEELCDILKKNMNLVKLKQILTDKVWGGKESIIVNGCIIFIFISTEGKLEAYLSSDIAFNTLRSYENIQIAAEFAKRIWSDDIHLEDIN